MSARRSGSTVGSGVSGRFYRTAACGRGCFSGGRNRCRLRLSNPLPDYRLRWHTPTRQARGTPPPLPPWTLRARGNHTAGRWHSICPVARNQQHPTRPTPEFANKVPDSARQPRCVRMLPCLTWGSREGQKTPDLSFATETYVPLGGPWGATRGALAPGRPEGLVLVQAGWT